MTIEKSPQQIESLIHQFLDADTDDFSELAKIAELDLKKDFIGIDFSDEDLSNNIFTGANLTKANLSNTSLNNAILRNVQLREANITTASLVNADLTGADLTGADLTGADLTGADLTGAIWDNTTKFDSEIQHFFSDNFIQKVTVDSGASISVSNVIIDGKLSIPEEISSSKSEEIDTYRDDDASIRKWRSTKVLVRLRGFKGYEELAGILLACKSLAVKPFTSAFKTRQTNSNNAPGGVELSGRVRITNSDNAPEGVRLSGGIRLLGKLRSAKLEKFLPTQTVVGFPISAMSFDGQVDTIMQWAQARMSKMVCVANVHMLMEGHWNATFAQVLLTADLLTPDGLPLVWIASLMKRQPQDRVAGMELMQALSAQAQEKKVSLFLLGATPEMLLQIRQCLARDFPDLQVAGTLAPPFRPLSEEEEEAIANEINASGAGLVFVSLGCPKQERWMGKHRGQVKAVMVGLGGAFSVYAGEKQWAPELVRRYGMEWCYRLLQEPGRWWKRYATTLPPFVWLAFKQVVKVRLGMDPDRSLRQPSQVDESI